MLERVPAVVNIRWSLDDDENTVLYRIDDRCGSSLEIPPPQLSDISKFFVFCVRIV